MQFAEAALVHKDKIVVEGHSVEAWRGGTGKPIVFLHGGGVFSQNTPFLELLAARWSVLSPRHPGFGGSAQPATIRTIDDLAYFYLDMLDALDLEDVVLVGSSFGGWIASEICVRSTARISGLVLIGSVGCKFGGREEREIADIYALPDDEVLRRTYAQPERWMPDYTKLSEAEVTEIVRDRVALTRFGWRPYMHNPALGNWLHRIKVPTLVVWGEKDGIVSTDYGHKFATRIPGASFVTEPGAGHFPQIEKPADIAKKVEAFAAAAADRH